MDPGFFSIYNCTSFLYGTIKNMFHLGDRVHLAEDRAVTKKGDFWRFVVTKHDHVAQRGGKPGQKYIF
jgi:hypothetical protein